jgi:hypothetical protein
MQRKATSLILLIAGVAGLSYTAEWRLEIPILLKDELKSVYNTNLYFASRDNITDYVAISENVVLFAINQIGIFLYDLEQDDVTKIPSPFDLREVIVSDMSYDKKNNAVHIIVVENAPRTYFHYYVLGLVTYSWEKIEELSYPVFRLGYTYYDSSDEKIYCVETSSGDIAIFDFQNRKIIEKVKLFEDESYQIHAIYGNPVCLLGGIRTGKEYDDVYYFVYDFQTKTKEIFQNTVGKRGRSYAPNYVPLGKYRFLYKQGISWAGTNIVEIDLRNNTYKTVTFNYSLSHLKKNNEDLMNFIVTEDIGHFQRIDRYSFCSWEYPK